MAWQIEYKGVRKELALWKVQEPVINYASQDDDKFSFQIVQDFDADDVFGYGETVKLFKDGVGWFSGLVIMTPRRCRAAGEEVGYQAVGPWYYLNQQPFRIKWANRFFCSHLILNMKGAGALATTAEQASSILDFVLGLYPADKKPFQKGRVLPGIAMYAPFDEVREITCGQALRRVLQWHRDVVTWFDYRTDPPTFNIDREPNLEVVDLAMPNTTPTPTIESVEIVPRPELQRPSVVIVYEKTNTVDGVPVPDPSIDAYPPGATGQELGALTLSVDLMGFNLNRLQGSLVTEEIQLSQAWFVKQRGWLGLPVGTRIAGLVLKDFKRSGSMNLPNMLVEGSIAPWMLNGGAPIQWEHETITAKASYTASAADVNPATFSYDEVAGRNEKLIEIKIVACDAPVGESSYTATKTFEDGDPQPVGLAQFIYDSLKDLKYSGQVTTVEAELSGDVRIGKRVNLTGTKRPEYATMKAMVQQVSEDIESGRTTGTVGPPEHLGIQDLVELLKVGRWRLRWTNPRTIETGESDEMSLGKPTAKHDGDVGEGWTSMLRLLASPPQATPFGAGTANNSTQIRMDAGVNWIKMQRKDWPDKVEMFTDSSVFSTVDGQSTGKGHAALSVTGKIKHPDTGAVIQAGGFVLDLDHLPKYPPFSADPEAVTLRARVVNVCYLDAQGGFVNGQAVVLMGKPVAIVT